MTTATFLSVVFNFVIIYGDHSHKVILTLFIGGHSELYIEDGCNHNTFVAVVILAVYIVAVLFKSANKYSAHFPLLM